MKYALVTGGSRGIGRAVSCKLAEMGYFILINYQSNDAEAEKTLQLVQEKGSNGEIMKFERKVSPDMRLLPIPFPLS